MQDLFGNMPTVVSNSDWENKNPGDEVHKPFKFTELERLVICDKISDFATFLVDNAEHPSDDDVIDLVNEIEDLIAKEVEQA